jgi:hypothetical protein
MEIGWPQGIYLAFVALHLILAAIMDGEPRTGKHKFSIAFVASLIGLGLLYWGGFFGRAA